MPTSLEHAKLVLSHQKSEELRRALQIASAWLQLLADKFDLDEDETIATVTRQPSGEIIAKVSIGEALDIANTALEPEPA